MLKAATPNIVFSQFRVTELRDEVQDEGKGELVLKHHSLIYKIPCEL